MMEAGIGCCRTDATARDPIARTPPTALLALPRARDEPPRERVRGRDPDEREDEDRCPPAEASPPEPLRDLDAFEALDDDDVRLLRAMIRTPALLWRAP
jgi:hypothetical protein